jgi:phospholipase C
MLVVVTYDEKRGLPAITSRRPRATTRIPTLIISPYAKEGFVDHTQYDTTSILRFITERFDLPVLPGLAARDLALKKHGQQAMGDLTAALGFHQ